MYNLWERIKSGIFELVQSRVFVVVLLFCVMSGILVQRVFYLQIVKGQEYFDDYKLQIQKTRSVEGTRGNIYDRNGKLLAYNELAYAVMIEDNGDYESLTQKNKEINKVVTKVIRMVEDNGDSVINNFGIILDSNQEYRFMEKNETARMRFIADVYGKRTIDQLSEKQQNASAKDVIDYLCTDKISGYGIDQKKLSPAEVLKLVNIRYAISLNSYQKYIATTIADDVSDETVADIMENLDSLQGVSIEEESLRRYTDSVCFANVIGYTGQISTEEYDALSKEEQEAYDKTDTIGKAGIEKTMDSVLQGEKGEEKLYVNSVGKVIETAKGKNPKAGNNLYLTIDADLQKVAYHVIEQELAGILISKIKNIADYDRETVQEGNDVIIPITDVYHTLVNNDILDMKHFSAEDAREGEKEIEAVFLERKEAVKESLKKSLQDPQAPALTNLGKEEQAYMNYLVNHVLSSSLMKNRIDKGDAGYKNWKKDGSINAYTFLQHALSQNWIDTSLLREYVKGGHTYSSSEELYNAMIEYGLDQLSSDSEFDKILYKYLIVGGSVTGRQLCMALFEQGILQEDAGSYEGLKAGSVDAYSFIMSKIENLELTPGQLALEPCTGSMVVTDPGSGQVLASVSYPGYDNNRLVNTMDSNYYNKLVMDKSRPFYNNATQERTAPGSVYKPLTAVAGLTEGIIDLNTYVNCTGSFDRVEPSPKCWIYPGAHGPLNVEGAIAHSCNIFFYELGYQMSLQKADGTASGQTGGNRTTDGTSSFSSRKGTDILKKYAEEFGLGSTSGIEIPESEPQISDEYSILSAIGQGTNNYTTSQLARYMATMANKGNLYDLTLLQKETSSKGELIKEYQPKVKKQATNVADTTWNAVQSGMRQVVTSTYATTFSKINGSGVSVSGKTGTAQQSRTHADHSLFAGYAPSDDPKIAFSIRIANGYGSTHAVEIGKYVLEYYYQLTDPSEILTGKAFNVSSDIIVTD